ncbi:aromatic prenyltransferase [Xylaria arbuscula]|nr:aromatic prenyltransferase [Xylaria arbuscula]
MSNTFISQPTPVAQAADSTSDSEYWWRTSGRDVANMLDEAGYADEVKRRFLAYYRETLCPSLGVKPSSASAKSGLGWDGTPFEYSFELKSSKASESVRFAADFADLSPPGDNSGNPLDLTRARKVVQSLAGRTPDFDDSWYRSLVKFFDQSHHSKQKQFEIISKAGHQTPLVVGFDLHSRLSSNPEGIPAMGKVYFPPCHYAAAESITRWDAVYRAIHQLPDIKSFPNILKSLDSIKDYLETKPASWKDGARYLATDLVAPGQARLKIYLRYPGESFDEIWDYYTLGGRIPALEADKTLLRDLIELTGPGSTGTAGNGDRTNGHLDYTNFRRKMTCVYFSLSPNNPTPAPKIGIYPANVAANDAVIARGLDAWLQKYEWPLPSKSIEQQLASVFSHRRPEEKTGLFTFISVGRKEDPTKKDLSMQIYLTPELYSYPRTLV